MRIKNGAEKSKSRYLNFSHSGMSPKSLIRFLHSLLKIKATNDSKEINIGHLNVTSLSLLGKEACLKCTLRK